MSERVNTKPMQSKPLGWYYEEKYNLEKNATRGKFSEDDIDTNITIRGDY